jgi:NitT/TauT family transport system permease protein
VSVSTKQAFARPFPTKSAADARGTLPWPAIAVVLAALGAWEFSSRLGWASPLYFPAPSVIVRTVVRMAATGELEGHLVASVRRLASGVLLGGLPGLALGLLMGWSLRARQQLDPVVAALHPIPKIAMFPLLMILFGLGEAPRVLVIAVAAFFPMTINTMAGVRQISPIHFEVAANYGARRRRVLTGVVLPGSLPLILAGARLALNSALHLTIAVELVASEDGLGAVMWMARETLRTEELYAMLVVVSILGIGMNFALQRLSTRLVPWQVRPEV